MARTYGQIFRDEALRQVTNIQERANQTIERMVDRVTNAPAHLQRQGEQAKETMATKMDVLRTVIDTKLLLRDRFAGEVSDEDFALCLASDPNMRKTAEQLIHPVLNPTPVETVRSNTSNGFVDIGAGLSTFWTEMHQTLPIEIQEAMEVENVLMNLEAGMDPNMEPDTRKLFLKEAGISDELVSELVPLSAYAEYENKMKEVIRREVRTELGLDTAKELTEEQQLIVDAMTEDRVMGTKLQPDMDDPAFAQGPTYEETYRISAQDLYTMFEDQPAEELPPDLPYDGKQVPLDDESWGPILEQPLDELNQLYDSSIDENMALLEQWQAEETARGLMDGMEPPVITEEDLAFAESMEQEPTLSDADLAFADELADDSLNH